jgi:hypothetical protein
VIGTLTSHDPTGDFIVLRAEEERGIVSIALTDFIALNASPA